MPERRITIDGTTHVFPDDFTDDDIAAALGGPPQDTTLKAVSPDEPDTLWAGRFKGFNDHLTDVGRSMFQSAAAPQSAGDFASLLLPTTAMGTGLRALEGWSGAAQNLAKGGAAGMRAAEPGLMSKPRGFMRGMFIDALDNPQTAIKQFRGEPMPPTPQRPPTVQPSRPDAWDRARETPFHEQPLHQQMDQLPTEGPLPEGRQGGAPSADRPYPPDTQAARGQPYDRDVRHVTTPEGAAGIRAGGFDINRGGGLGGDMYGPGAYLGDANSDVAGFWRSQLETKNATGTVPTEVMPGKAALKNALVVEDVRPGAGPMRPLDRRSIVAQHMPDRVASFDALVKGGQSPNQALGQVAREAGYDGLVFQRYGGDEIVAFDAGGVNFQGPTNVAQPTTQAPAAQGFSEAERASLKSRMKMTDEAIAKLEEQTFGKATTPQTTGTLRMAPTEPTRPPIQVDESSLPEAWKPHATAPPAEGPAQGHLLDPSRVDIGAEKAGRPHGMNKHEVRNVTSQVVDEAHGEASPILPKEPMGRIIDKLRSMPPGGPEREAYVKSATSGWAQAQVELLRRALEHMGMLVPIAAGAGALKDTIMRRLSGPTPPEQ